MLTLTGPTNLVTYNETPGRPFSGVTVSEPPGVIDTVYAAESPQTGYFNYSADLNVVVTEVSPTELALTGPAPDLTYVIDSFTYTPVGPGVVGFGLSDLSGSVIGLSVTDIDPSVPPPPPVAPTVPPPLSVEDTSLNQALTPSFQAYTGPVAGVQNEYINAGTDGLNITASTPNWFIHSGGGNDAIAVSGGTNVLDGGTGSNFLTGGSGTDTFFVDDRNAPADIWSTVNNFHAGDAATIWGVTPQDFSLDWADSQGAAGYQGLTLHATAPGAPTASLTLAGFSQSDLNDGRLSVSFGSSNGSSYMYVHDNS